MLRDHEHATDTQNSNYGTLVAAFHAQVPDQCHGKQPNSQVGDSGANTVQVRNTDEDICINARAIGLRLCAVPEKVDGGALEHGEEEKDETNGGG